MDLYCKLLIIILLLIANAVFGQTGTINVDQNHTGHKIFGLPTPTASNEAATKGYADSIGGGGGGTGTVTSSKLSALGMPTSRDFRRISRDFAPSLFSDGSFMVRTPLQSLV